MKIDITDNRQEMLIKLGEKLAKASNDERIARELHEESYRKLREIEDEIIRIGTYIIEAREEE